MHDNFTFLRSLLQHYYQRQLQTAKTHPPDRGDLSQTAPCSWRGAGIDRNQSGQPAGDVRKHHLADPATHTDKRPVGHVLLVHHTGLPSRLLVVWNQTALHQFANRFDVAAGVVPGCGRARRARLARRRRARRAKLPMPPARSAPGKVLGLGAALAVPGPETAAC